jgi:hypothetical protein
LPVLFLNYKKLLIMSRGQSNRGNNRGSEKSNGRGGRRNISSRRGLSAMDDDTQRRTSFKSGKISHGGDRGRISEDSDRSE